MESSSRQQQTLARIGVITLAALATAFPGPVRAGSVAPEPATPSVGDESEDIRRARELAANGSALYAEGSYAAAIKAFEVAYDLAKDPNLLYNIAICHEKAGDLEVAADALDRYRAVAPESERDGLGQRAAQLRARAEAEAAPPPGPREPEPTEPQPSHTPEASPPPPTPLFSPAAWALLGVSVVGLGLGTTFGVLSLRNGNDAEQACRADDVTLCPTSAMDGLSTARWQAAAADVSFAVGAGAAIGLAVVLAVRARKRKSAVALVPMPGGLAFGGAFGHAGTTRRASR